MKKILIASILLLTSVASFAQTINYGVKGGINFSELLLKEAPLQSVQNDYVTGFNVGVVVEVGFQKFSIQPGLFFTTKGGKVSAREVYPNGQSPRTINPTFNSNYFELPVNFLYRLKISPVLSFHIGGGPYIGYESSASATDKTNPGPGQNGNVAISFNNPDYGLNFETGLKLNARFLIDVDYGLGLANIGSPAIERNRTLSFSIGFVLK